MIRRGLFITVEGVEGVGKSTNLAHLESALTAGGVEVIVTREPGGTALGEEIRALMLAVREQPVSAMAELLLVFAARAQHLAELIEPHLAAGRWVLCDRFTDATFAYQGGGRGVPMEHIAALEQLVQGGVRPDFTLLLDMPVEDGMARARGRGELDRIERETMDFFRDVRAAYLSLAATGGARYRIVNAGRALAEVQADVGDFASDLLAGWSTP